MGCLYKLTSPSRKSYIGITLKSASERWEKHQEHARGKRNNGALYSALRKYGPDSFTLEVLITSDDWESLCKLEREFIQKFKTLSPGGYNIALGGEGVQGKRSEADKRKISEAQKKRFQDPEERRKLIERGLKASQSEEFRKAQSVRSKLMMKDPAMRARLSAAAKRQFSSPESRKSQSERTRIALANPALRLKMSEIQKAFQSKVRAMKAATSPQLSLPLT
jgi:group I intron endonuclease